MTDRSRRSTGARAVPELQRLRADHGPAVLAFEKANRGYFAASISDRPTRRPSAGDRAAGTNDG